MWFAHTWAIVDKKNILTQTIWNKDINKLVLLIFCGIYLVTHALTLISVQQSHHWY